jgi:transcriptional regulator with PAS, ATPase and Fis domain
MGVERVPNHNPLRTLSVKSSQGTRAREYPLSTLHIGADEILYRSSAMHSVMATVKLIAQSDASVLLLGESGSGKEVIARAIHALSRRASGAFVPINCASLSGEILENELFGHERGAFTSADAQKPGLFELADGGTVFLDEINEIGLQVQPKLLRVLERREFRRVGGTRKIKVDLRIIAASNVDLDAEVRMRRFREDLYYRLKVVTLVMPPLRERREDIADLARAFLRRLRGTGERPRDFSEQALARLRTYAWPGNVRELKNTVESVAVMTNRDMVELHDLPPNVRASGVPAELVLKVGLTMFEIEREVLRVYLETYPTKKAVAKALGIGLRTLHAKVKEHRLGRSRKESSAA